jgi:hypothetical protein
MIVLVCGGRDYLNAKRIYDILDSLINVELIIHGGANGADFCAGEWAKSKDIHCSEIRAIWYPARGGVLDRGAGPKRNRIMIKLKPDLVVAFPGGRGTEDMVRVAEENNVRVLRVA